MVKQRKKTPSALPVSAVCILANWFMMGLIAPEIWISYTKDSYKFFYACHNQIYFQ